MYKLITFLLTKLLQTIAGICFLSCLLYWQGSIFDFESTIPFSGQKINNPYQYSNFQQDQKANFHAHSHAWNGLTNGEHTEQDVFDAYQKQAYAAIGISNYHKIFEAQKGAFLLNIPTYEHGYNLFKSHKLAIGAKQAVFFDFPFFQITSNKQTLINHSKKYTEYLVLAHPGLRDGYTENELRKLTSYDALEVSSGFGQYFSHWDAALSSGKLVWGMANDDTHNVKNTEESFKNWNQLLGEKTPEGVLNDLKHGNFYGVSSSSGKAPAKLIKAKVGEDSIQVTFDKEMEITWIAANGEVLRKDNGTKSSVLPLNALQSYLRVEARNRDGLIFLNPFTKFSGEKPLLNSASYSSENRAQTFIYRISISSISLLLLLFILPGLRRKMWRRIPLIPIARNKVPERRFTLRWKN